MPSPALSNPSIICHRLKQVTDWPGVAELTRQKQTTTNNRLFTLNYYNYNLNLNLKRNKGTLKVTFQRKVTQLLRIKFSLSWTQKVELTGKKVRKVLWEELRSVLVSRVSAAVTPNQALSGFQI